MYLGFQCFPDCERRTQQTILDKSLDKGGLGVRKKEKYAILFAILVVATFLRLHNLTTTPPGLYLDEAIEGDNASQAAVTGHYRVFYTEDNGREGLYVNLIAILFEYFHAPHEPWVVRFPAVVAGVLTVLGMGLLASELFGDCVGLLAAFLLATSFWHINFSRIGFRAILAPLFLTWAIYLLIKAFRTPSSRAAWMWTASAGTTYALGSRNKILSGSGQAIEKASHRGPSEKAAVRTVPRGSSNLKCCSAFEAILPRLTHSTVE